MASIGVFSTVASNTMLEPPGHSSMTLLRKALVPSMICLDDTNEVDIELLFKFDTGWDACKPGISKVSCCFVGIVIVHIALTPFCHSTTGGACF